jgi:hypothetical protein
VNVADIVSEVEIAGVAFQLEGERVHVEYPDDECREELAEQIAFLRARRAEVIAFLKTRSVVPPMPEGVRLVRWEPKSGPVAIDVCSVVVDVAKFIHSELRALDSRLNNPWTIHGGFTVPQMLDRLAQAGLEVELEPKGKAPMPSDRTERTTKHQETKGGPETAPPGHGQ